MSANPGDILDAIHPNLKQLSHSSDQLLHRCPRQYELYKLSPATATQELRAINQHEELYYKDEDNPHLSFGSVVGIGTQHLLCGGSYNSAVMLMLQAWEGHIDDEAGQWDKKTFWHALFALDKFIAFKQIALSNFTIATFDGKPAIELGFVIHCGGGFTYRGFLDALLIDTLRKELVVYEGKTTKSTSLHQAAYKNSGQALGYSLIIDAIIARLGLPEVGAFKVLYSIYKTKSYEWEKFDFPKTRTQRALWIRNILFNMQHIREYAEAQYFPMHGESCLAFFRPCNWFEICEMSNETMFGEELPAVKVDDPNKYQFHFDLQELIDAQIAKQEEVL